MSTGIKNQTRDTILYIASIDITTLFNEFYFYSGKKINQTLPVCIYESWSIDKLTDLTKKSSGLSKTLNTLILC